MSTPKAKEPQLQVLLGKETEERLGADMAPENNDGQHQAKPDRS